MVIVLSATTTHIYIYNRCVSLIPHTLTSILDLSMLTSVQYRVIITQPNPTQPTLYDIISLAPMLITADIRISSAFFNTRSLLRVRFISQSRR